MNARKTTPYRLTDELYLWLLRQPSRPVYIDELHLVRTTRGVSLRYAPDWLQRGFPLSEDLPLIDDEILPTEQARENSGSSSSRTASLRTLP